MQAYHARCSCRATSLQDAACWLRKARLAGQPLTELAELLKEMGRALQILSARVALCDKAAAQKPARQVPLVAPWASRDPEDDEMGPVDAPSAASGLDAGCVQSRLKLTRDMQCRGSLGKHTCESVAHLGCPQRGVCCDTWLPRHLRIPSCACMRLSVDGWAASHKQHFTQCLHCVPCCCRVSNPDTGSASYDDSDEQSSQLFTEMGISLNKLVGQTGKAEITAALRTQLQHGDVVSACRCPSRLACNLEVMATRSSTWGVWPLGVLQTSGIGSNCTGTNIYVCALRQKRVVGHCSCAE